LLFPDAAARRLPRLPVQRQSDSRRWWVSPPLQQRRQLEALCPADVDDLVERQPRAGRLASVHAGPALAPLLDELGDKRPALPAAGSLPDFGLLGLGVNVVTEASLHPVGAARGWFSGQSR